MKKVTISCGCFNWLLEKCHYDLLRNTAVGTVEQELLFVGAENGKLIAVRDIIKKVRTSLSSLYFLSVRHFSEL